MPKHGEKGNGICAVHYYVDNDLSVREVYWCHVCDEWICNKCWYNIPKRAIAMAKKKKLLK